MTQLNLIELAKLGNPKAIATLMNRHLEPKGVTVKVSISNDCLMVIAESTHLPDQSFLVYFVRKGMTALQAQAIKRVIVWGQTSGKTTPEWKEAFELDNDVSFPKVEPSPSANEQNIPDQKTAKNQVLPKFNLLHQALNIIYKLTPPLTLFLGGLFILIMAFYAASEILLVKQNSQIASSSEAGKSINTELAVVKPENFIEIYLSSIINQEKNSSAYWCSDSKNYVRPFGYPKNWKIIKVTKYGFASIDAWVKLYYSKKEDSRIRDWDIYIKKESAPDWANKLPGGWCIASIYEKND